MTFDEQVEEVNAKLGMIRTFTFGARWSGHNNHGDGVNNIYKAKHDPEYIQDKKKTSLGLYMILIIYY